MKILCLYNNDFALELFQWLENEGHEIVLSSEKLDISWCEEQQFDLAVSYTYRYILSAQIIHALNKNVVNLHNSFLPFNRGADPNLWSIVDETPRGVTLHYIDTKLDKGFIIAQAFVNDGEDETFESSYFNLDKAAKKLFKEAFNNYKYWPELKKKAVGCGSYHALKDGVKIKALIESYKIKIKDFKAILHDSWGGVRALIRLQFAGCW